MSILETIHTPADVKALGEDQLPQLCQEIREFLVRSVSETGGHLASSLGVVELTVAIHRVFDTSRDRLVFDVGHQCYAHKLLTGRRDDFARLRQLGGISGFPKPEESVHDAFIAGHASDSVSVALGMARAATLSGENYRCIALIGDGAMTGGLSYEGLSDAGDSGEPLIVILNDNGMAINRNVGGIAQYLRRERTKPSYFAFKKNYRKFMQKLPGGKGLYRFNHRLKTVIKELYFHSSMFEEMGFEYLGPVDGHDLRQLETTLTWARELKKPVIVHVITQKGKGYQFSEENPDLYHGVAAFDPVVCLEPSDKKNFSAVFGEELEKLARRSPKVCAVTAAMTQGTGLTDFAKKYPRRFFDVGIAEEHAVSMAAGLAKQGMIPVFAVYSTFLQRAYDMLVHDVALQGLHVVFAVDRAGLVGEDGATHQGLYDLAYLSSVPGMQILAPASYAELSVMLEKAVLEMDGPVAVRFPRGGEGRYVSGGFEPVKKLRDGGDVTLVTHGITVNAALQAAAALKKQGVEADVLKLDRVSPIGFEPVLASGKKTGRVFVAEECEENGSAGQRIAALFAESGAALKTLRLLNTGNRFIAHGSVAELRKLCGLDGESICGAVLSALMPEKTGEIH